MSPLDDMSSNFCDLQEAKRIKGRGGKGGRERCLKITLTCPRFKQFVWSLILVEREEAFTPNTDVTIYDGVVAFSAVRGRTGNEAKPGREPHAASVAT